MQLSEDTSASADVSRELVLLRYAPVNSKPLDLLLVLLHDRRELACHLQPVQGLGKSCNVRLCIDEPGVRERALDGSQGAQDGFLRRRGFPNKFERYLTWHTESHQSVRAACLAEFVHKLVSTQSSTWQLVVQLELEVHFSSSKEDFPVSRLARVCLGYECRRCICRRFCRTLK